MVELKVLSGKTAGHTFVARRFPFRIGRSATSDLQTEEAGVWDDHLEIGLDRKQGFILKVRAEAMATINGEPFKEALLHNGDAIGIGALKLRFWLGKTCQPGLSLREGLTWTAITCITAGQLALIYWLIR